MQQSVSKSLVGLVCLTAILGGCSRSAETGWTETSLPPAPENVATAQRAAKALGASLKTALMDAMQADGPVAAISVCHDQAPEIAANLETVPGMHVGRTAMKTRNPDNAPDSWERDQLRAFARRLANGEAAADMSVSAMFQQDGQHRMRWMSPIMTADVCTVCHGEDIAPEISAAIAARYPEDAATGFAAGDLRGAFTVTVPVVDAEAG